MKFRLSRSRDYEQLSVWQDLKSASWFPAPETISVLLKHLETQPESVALKDYFGAFEINLVRRKTVEKLDLIFFLNKFVMHVSSVLLSSVSFAS